MQRRLWLLLGACAAFYVILALDIFPWLRGDFGWRHNYAAPEFVRLLPALAVVGVYVLGVLRLRRALPALQLAWYFAGAAIIPFACLYILDNPLYRLTTHTLSGGTTGMHMAGVALADLNRALYEWPALMPTFLEPGRYLMTSVHVALGPPGLPALYYGLTRLFEALPGLAEPLGMALRPYQCHNIALMGYTNAELASAWLGVLMPIWAALTVFLLYYAERARSGVRWAAAWWPLVPSVSLFTPNWNTLYPLFALIAYLLIDSALRQYLADKSEVRRFGLNARLLAAGALCSLLTFANISTVPLIGLLGVYIAVALLRANQDHIAPAIQGSILLGVPFAIGLASVWVLYFLGYGVTPFQILATALTQHLTLERPYLPWVFLHVYDLLLFVGLPVALLALLRAGRDPLAAALAITLGIMTLSGTARGETGRVWLFFAPFMLLVASRWLADREAAGWVMAAQALALIVLAGFLRVMNTELSPPPPVPAQPAVEVAALADPATFAGALTLTGAEAHFGSGAQIDLTLRWRVDRQVAAPYFFSALPVGPDGDAAGRATDWQPFDTRYPTTCWPPGQIVTESRRVALDNPPRSGDYWISLSAFELRDGHPVRAAVTRSGGAGQGDQVGIRPIRRGD